MGTLVQQQAPAFRTQAVVGRTFRQVSSQDYRGKWLVLFFYPLDFTYVCPTEITAFSDRIEEFHQMDAEVLGCSVDSHFAHLAWMNIPRQEGGLGELAFPLLSDLDRQISSAYGILASSGVALRALFLIDPGGRVAYEVVHDLGVGRNVDEVLRVLGALQQSARTGEVCPANWKPGEPAIRPDPVGAREYFGRRR